MRPLTPFLLIPFILLACHSAPKPIAGLTTTSIYTFDSVRIAAVTGDEKAARKQFLAAMDAYKNKKDIPKSIGLFKRSIQLKPTAQAYYELGGALMAQGDYNEAVYALHIAEKMQYKPLAGALIRLSAAYANSKGLFEADYQKDSAALHYMEISLQMGYAHPEEFLNSELFTRLMDESAKRLYKQVLAAGSNIKDPEQSLWQEFKNEFTAVSLPLTINDAWIGAHTRQEHQFRL
jgi:tetratricopeptide (TPR) repeat protein